MKKLISATLLGAVMLLVPGRVRAQIATVNVSEAYQSTASCYGIQVSSYGDVANGATQVIQSTTSLWRNAQLWDLDATNVINCAPWNTSVSSQTATFSSNFGFPIEPVGTSNGLPTGIPLYPGELLYCVNGSRTGKAVLAVCVGR